jgi:hypothetical protein
MRFFRVVLPLLWACSLYAGSQSSSQLAWTSEPQRCLKKGDFPCAVVAVKKLDFNWNGINIVLSPNASLFLKSKKDIQFLKGDFFVEGKIKNAKIGAMEIQGKSQFLLHFHQGKSILRVLRGDALTVKFNGRDFERLPPGFENWYQGIAVNGKLNSGVMKPYETDQIFPVIAEMMIGTKAEKVEALVEIRKTWAQSRDLASTYYGREVQAELINEVNELRRQAEYRQMQNAKASQMRKLFRKKNNLEY